MRVLILGAGGMLGQAVVRILTDHDFEVHPFTRAQLDVTDTQLVRETISGIAPEAVINCAAFTSVDEAEIEKDKAYRINAIAAAHVARGCSEIGARCVYPSSDYVFDGTAQVPYTPDASPAPLGVYGRSKLAGEHGTREATDYLIVRTSWLYGPGGRNFVRTIADKARTGQPLRVVNDQFGAPTWTHDLARALAALLKHAAPTGTYHATNRESTSWYDFALEITRALGIDAVVEPCSSADYAARAPRPAFSVLDCSATERLIGPLRDWRTALREALHTGSF